MSNQIPVRTRGFTLLEVMCALIIFSIGAAVLLRSLVHIAALLDRVTYRAHAAVYAARIAGAAQANGYCASEDSVEEQQEVVALGARVVQMTVRKEPLDCVVDFGVSPAANTSVSEFQCERARITVSRVHIKNTGAGDDVLIAPLVVPGGNL